MKRNFVAIEELNNGIKYYYQFMDENTKKDYLTQDYHETDS